MYVPVRCTHHFKSSKHSPPQKTFESVSGGEVANFGPIRCVFCLTSMLLAPQLKPTWRTACIFDRLEVWTFICNTWKDLKHCSLEWQARGQVGCPLLEDWRAAHSRPDKSLTTAHSWEIPCHRQSQGTY